MRLRRLVFLVPALAGLTLPAAAGARDSAAGVRVLECSQGPSASDRHATFRAVAARVAGARSMRVRLRLEERTPRADWRPVGAPGLGVWRRSRPGVGRFAVRQRVLELAEGSSYRVLARFRWYDAGGKVILRARRRSRPCRQPGDLPNLRVRRVVVTSLAGPPLVAAYRVDVANRGSAPAPPSRVRLNVDGGVVDTVAVPSLAPGETRPVWLTGPPCGITLNATVDPSDAVREADELDNTLVRDCDSP